MKKLSPQQEIIISALRDMKWHCGREWLNQIKDDRARISNLNNFYMAERGHTIKGEPCKGEICGVRDCPLFKRKAVKIGATANAEQPQTETRAQILAHAKKMCEAFDVRGEFGYAM